MSTFLSDRPSLDNHGSIMGLTTCFFLTWDDSNQEQQPVIFTIPAPFPLCPMRYALCTMRPAGPARCYLVSQKVASFSVFQINLSAQEISRQR